MKKSTIVVVLLLVLVLLVGWFFTRFFSQQTLSFDLPQLALEVEAAQVKALPLVYRAAGQVVSKHSVAIQPQVSGLLKSVHFKEGTQVNRGQLLLTIDSAPFEARLQVAKAAYTSANATAQRNENLRSKGFVTDQEYDDAMAARDKAQAEMRLAEIDLAYTRMTSPIDGIAGVLAVKPGNLVTSNNQTLVTINQIKPIEVTFSLPQQVLAEVKKRQASGSLTVNIYSEQGNQLLSTGELSFIANQIDAANGAFLLKASLPNADESLWPGQFVTAELVVGYQDVLVIPAIALQSGQVGSFVYQIKAGEVVATPIVLNREQDKWAVIEQGLKAGDEVVVQATRSLRVGMPATSHLAQPAEASVP